MSSIVNPIPTIFHYDEVNRLLICKPCGYALNNLRTGDHLALPVHRHLPPSLRNEAKEWAAALPCFGNQADFQRQPNYEAPINAIRHVEVFNTGFKCDTCNKVFGTKGSAKKHKHSDSIPTWTTGISISKIFGGSSELTEIRLSSDVSATTENTDNPRSQQSFFKGCLGQYDEHLHRLDVERAQVPEIDETEMTPWLHRTGWVIHLQGKDIPTLIDCYGLPTEPHLIRLRKSNRSLIQKCVRGAQLTQCHAYILRLLDSNSEKSRDIGGKPMVFNQGHSTVDEYSDHWAKFLCYFIRSRGSSASADVPCNGEQDMAIEDLVDTIRDPHSQGQKIESAIFKLSMTVIKQQSFTTAFDNPLIHYLAIEGLSPSASPNSPRKLCFKQAFSYTPFLSAIVTVCRVMFLEDAIPLSTRSSLDRSPIVAFRQYHEEFIADASLTPLSEVISLRNYGLTIASEHYNRPKVTFSYDHSKIYYLDQTIMFDDLVSMIQKTICEANDLVQELTFRPQAEYLPTRDPSLFVDDLSWCGNGHSFVDFPENNLSRGHERVLRWYNEQMDGKDLATFRNGTWRFRTDIVNNYGGLVKQLQKKLAFLLHTTPGLPSRGTEFLSGKIANTISSARNFLMYDGSLVVIIEHSKTKNTTGSPRIIPKFTPNSVGRLYVSFVSDILPFLKFIQHASDIELTHDTPHIWSQNGKRWDTDKLSNIIADITKTHLDARLTVSSYRQVACCVARDMFGIVSPNDIDIYADFMVDMMSGHSTSTGDRHYGGGISFNDLTSLSPTTLSQMRECSMQWHRLLGLLEPPNSTTKHLAVPGHVVHPIARPSKRKSQSDSSNNPKRVFTSHPRHPTFTHGNSTSNSSPLVRVPSSPNTPLPSPRTNSEKIEHAMKMTYKSPKPLFKSKEQQRAITHAAMNNPDTIAILPTGGGKTATYIVAAALQPFTTTIVLTPYIALTESAMAFARSKGIQCMEWRKDYDRSSDAHTTLVFVSAENAGEDLFMTYANNIRSRLCRIVFDEGHTIVLDKVWRIAMANIHRLARYDAQKVVLSGSLTKIQETMLCQELGLEDVVVVRASTNRPTISYRVSIHSEDALFDSFVEMIRLESARMEGGKILIFAPTINTVDSLAEVLQCPRYYNKHSSKELDLQRFANDPHCNILVGTTAIASGINLPNVTRIYHFKELYQFHSFVQGTGRGGRAGEHVISTIVISDREREKHRCNVHNPDPEMSVMSNFVTTNGCRRDVMSINQDGRLHTCTVEDDPCDNCIENRRRRMD